MRIVRLYEVEDSDIVFGRGCQFTRRSCYQQFRQLLIQRKEQYRTYALSVRSNLIAEIIGLAIGDGMAFFQFRPAANVAVEMTRTQLIYKIRQMFTDIFKIDDGKCKPDKEGSRLSSAKYRSKRSSPATFARPTDENTQSEYFVFDPQQAEPATERACHSEMVTATDPRQGMFPLRNAGMNTGQHASASLPNTLERCLVYLNESLSSIERKQVADIKAAREHLQKLLEEHADVTTAQVKLSELSLQPERFRGIAANELLDSIVQNITGGGGSIEFAQDNSSLQKQRLDSHSTVQQNEDEQMHRDSAYGRFNDSFQAQTPSEPPNHPVRRVSLVAPDVQGVSQQHSQCYPNLEEYAMAVFQWNAAERKRAEVSPVESVRIKIPERRLNVSHHCVPQPIPARPREQVMNERNHPSFPMFTAPTVKIPYWPMRGGRTKQVNGGTRTAAVNPNTVKNRPQTHPGQLMGGSERVELSGNGTSRQLYSQRSLTLHHRMSHPPFVSRGQPLMTKPQRAPDHASGATEAAQGVNNVSPGRVETGP